MAGSLGWSGGNCHLFGRNSNMYSQNAGLGRAGGAPGTLRWKDGSGHPAHLALGLRWARANITG